MKQILMMLLLLIGVVSCTEPEIDLIKEYRYGVIFDANGGEGEMESQSIVVNCRSMTLDEVLVGLTERYDVELSFDSELLSRHSVTINREFESVDHLLDNLLDGLPLGWELIGGAYVIFPKEIEKPKPIIGKIIDRQSGEPLPFAYVMVDGEAVASDGNGNFVVTPSEVEINRVKASYLGYYQLDTLQNIRANSRIRLTSATYIYGSGFPIYTNYKDKICTEPDYNRLDMSAMYSFTLKWCSGDVGLSILNITDTTNEKYSTFNRIPINQQNSISIDSGSTPFTPLLYLKLSL